MSVTIPHQLYTAEDLLGGFNPWDPMGYALSHDFSIYREFVANGGPLPASLAISAEQAAHDAAMADALRGFLKTVQRPLVGIMGGHSLPRNHHHACEDHTCLAMTQRGRIFYSSREVAPA